MMVNEQVTMYGLPARVQTVLVDIWLPAAHTFVGPGTTAWVGVLVGVDVGGNDVWVGVVVSVAVGGNGVFVGV